MVKKTKITDSTYFWFIIVIIIALVLIGMVLYWAKVLNDQSYYNYQGKSGIYEITKSKVSNVIFYSITVNARDITYIYSFRNHPEDLEEIYLEQDLYSKIKGKNVYVVKDLELDNMTNRDSLIAAANFEQVLGGAEGIYNVNISNTYTSFSRKTLPVVNCSNVTINTAVIYLKIGDESKVYSENGCIIIQGRGGNGLLMAAEKFAYYLLGVF